MHYRQTKTISIISAFAIGSLIGAGVALLMAPQSGYETRKMIRDKSTEIKDKASARIEDTRDKANRAIEDVSDKTRETAQSIRNRGKKIVESTTNR